MREPLDVLAEPITMNSLDRLDDAPVYRATALLQKSPVGDLVGQRVLEGVLEIGEQRGLVQELGRLQLRQPRPELFLRLLGKSREAGRRARPCR